MNSKSLKLSRIATLGLVLLASMAGSQVLDNSEALAVNDLVPLTLTLISSPNWGLVTRPPSGTARYTLNWQTGATTVVSGDGYAFNDGYFGSFILSGDANAAVTYSMSIGAFSGATPITVVASHINGTSSSGTGTLNFLGIKTLFLGGTIDIPSNASLGSQTATVTVTVDYQ